MRVVLKQHALHVNGFSTHVDLFTSMAKQNPYFCFEHFGSASGNFRFTHLGNVSQSLMEESTQLPKLVMIMMMMCKVMIKKFGAKARRPLTS